jgi:acyl-CoA thioester hydrolase
MELLYSSEVKSSEIDHLGHMNVRYYMERAQQANNVLTESLGLTPAACKALGARLVQHDTYTRYHREQFKGSQLVVRGGVLSAGRDGLSLYFEVANDEKQQIAATFILNVSLVERTTRRRLPLPEGAVASAAARLIEAPEHGRPRSLDLGAPRLDVRFEDLAERLGDDHGDPMSRRMERVIEAADCDEFGFLRDSQDMMFGTLRMPRPPQEGEGEPSWGPMTFTSDEGHRFGWASMETRTVRVSQPRAGDRLCSIGAEIALHGKARHSRRWIFNTTTGALVSLNDNVSVALDLDARRSIEIPSKVRSQLERRHFPEFA